MENLKIKVNNEAESREAQELFFELGETLGNGDKHAVLVPNIIGLAVIDGLINFIFNDVVFIDIKQCKELTLPELRDKVVLNRNCVDDATHTCNGHKYYLTASEFFEYINGYWENVDEYVDGCIFEPIEKEMKEYLEKQEDGSYELVLAYESNKEDGWIEIPEGAEIALEPAVTGGVAFYKNGFKFFYCESSLSWEKTSYSPENLAHWKSWRVLWQRPTQPEQLPFVDDETGYLMQGKNGEMLKKSIQELKGEDATLNDQYAEIEKVRQSAWDKQEGGSHYKKLAIQPMEYALKNKLDYAQANVVKYVTRHADKNGKEDLLKAIHNIELMIEHYYS